MALYTVTSNIPGLQMRPETAASAASAAAGSVDFGEMLGQAVEQVSDAQNVADDRLAALASGKEVDIHGTMIAMQEADISLRTMVSVRDRVVEAYQQMMNMAI